MQALQFLLEQHHERRREDPMLGNIVGPPARGSDFYDREELVDWLWEQLENSHVLLMGPRRSGKTSVMYRLIDHPRSGWKLIHVDAESIRQPVSFIVALLSALMEDRNISRFLLSSRQEACRLFSDLSGDAEPGDVALRIRLNEMLAKHWEERAAALLAVLNSYGQKLLIAIDEFPVMLQLFRYNEVASGEVKHFLYWLRKQRADLRNYRFLVGGSMGIDHFLSELNAADSFNDFVRVAVPVLSRERAADFLAQLLKGRGISLSDVAQRKVLDLLGAPIPYFIQLFVSEMAAEKANGARRMGKKRVEEVYQHRVLGASCKTYFQYYYDRLRHHDKPEEQAAKALLKAMALAHPGVVHATQLRAKYRDALGESATDDGFARLIGDLENDFYIHYLPEDDGYAFASKIMCDWWRRYYAF